MATCNIQPGYITHFTNRIYFYYYHLTHSEEVTQAADFLLWTKRLDVPNFIEKLFFPPLPTYYFKPYHKNKCGLFVKTSPKYEKHQETRSSPKT